MTIVFWFFFWDFASSGFVLGTWHALFYCNFFWRMSLSSNFIHKPRRRWVGAGKNYFVCFYNDTSCLGLGRLCFFHCFIVSHCNNVALAVWRFPVGSVVISQRNDFFFVFFGKANYVGSSLSDIHSSIYFYYFAIVRSFVINSIEFLVCRVVRYQTNTGTLRADKKSAKRGWLKYFVDEKNRDYAYESRNECKIKKYKRKARNTERTVHFKVLSINETENFVCGILFTNNPRLEAFSNVSRYARCVMETKRSEKTL